ncbi:hypothetical protein [Mycolicibacterium austroafricanum]|uniref:hypothetical protein n=1 Tax=Mycolicibacterium austroafricanum TaxID=39687 RepID=UPI001CA31C3A|nr:hypothetical protein [Mycolicibacterium austroafricanum]QZT59270.1 hypothetical protein JN084_12320 [Mycolicibacterium austroafricanum]
MTENNPPESTGTTEAGASGVDTAEKGSGAPAGESDTFSREYVEGLRKESAGYRDRANALAKRLHRELVAATNRLENPDDLAFDAEHLDDPEKLAAALEALLAERPYFAKRVVTGDAGQGNRGGATSGPESFADFFRG